MNDMGDPVERIKSLQEWAVKQASKYDMKYAKYNDARAWVMAQRYELVVELCDSAMKRRQVRIPYSYLVNQPQGRAE